MAAITHSLGLSKSHVVRITRRVVTSILLFCVPNVALAGGIYLSHPSLDGHVVGATRVRVTAGRRVPLCFFMEDYSYSGGRNSDSYAVFIVAPPNRPDGDLRTSDMVVKRFRALDDSTLDENKFKIEHCLDLPIPALAGTYRIQYSRLLMFASDFHLSDFTDDNVKSYALKHWKRWPEFKEGLLRFNVTTNLQSDAPTAVATYLRLNGDAPTIGQRIEPGLNKPPIMFSWFVKPQRSNVEYRYRLYPVEPEWSLWTTELQTTYYFVAPGAYQFQVASRTHDTDGKCVIGEPAKYQFFLEKPLIARPILKASGGKVSGGQPRIETSNLYTRSRALLIGVTKYDDQHFGPLPYTVNDVQQLAAVLQRAGFSTVTPLTGSLTRSQIGQAIDHFMRSAGRDERLLIYLSTHGFSDALDKTKAYVVSTDCHVDSPSTCLSLQELNGLLEPVLKTEHRVRHLVVLLDTCSAGLGVLAKSARYNELSVATKEGSHFMTAGLADQEAEQDPTLRMSTFTYFLAEGLSGKADYTQDGVVSLSELLVYVRYNVANYTHGRQTPMIGRLGGSGEMIFWPSGTKP